MIEFRLNLEIKFVINAYVVTTVKRKEIMVTLMVGKAVVLAVEVTEVVVAVEVAKVVAVGWWRLLGVGVAWGTNDVGGYKIPFFPIIMIVAFIRERLWICL